MSKEKLLPISIFCLSLSIIISALIISNGMQNNGRFIGDGVSSGINNINNTVNKEMSNNEISKEAYNLFEASAYLGISQEKIMDVINNKESGIPYIKIGADYIFSKKALDKWLETANLKM